MNRAGLTYQGSVPAALSLAERMDVEAFAEGSPSSIWTSSTFDSEEFVRMLRVDRTEHLHRSVAEATAIHETGFFRDRKLFDILRETVLPRLIGANSDRKTLRIWSAAASTGQEAYSVAMLLREHFAELADWDVKIVGTDLSRDAIDYARRGRYRRTEVNRGLPARKLVKYFARDADEWSIAPELRSMCEFLLADLREPLPLLPSFDLVLLRNVLLYLSAEERSGVFNSVRGQMTEDGYLVLGASEQAEDSTELFRAEPSREYYFYRSA